jgi:hypothetical protein
LCQLCLQHGINSEPQTDVIGLKLQICQHLLLGGECYDSHVNDSSSGLACEAISQGFIGNLVVCYSKGQERRKKEDGEEKVKNVIVNYLKHEFSFPTHVMKETVVGVATCWCYPFIW